MQVVPTFCVRISGEAFVFQLNSQLSHHGQVVSLLQVMVWRYHPFPRSLSLSRDVSDDKYSLAQDLSLVTLFPFHTVSVPRFEWIFFVVDHSFIFFMSPNPYQCLSSHRQPVSRVSLVDSLYQKSRSLSLCIHSMQWSITY